MEGIAKRLVSVIFDKISELNHYNELKQNLDLTTTTTTGSYNSKNSAPEFQTSFITDETTRPLHADYSFSYPFSSIRAQKSFKNSNFNNNTLLLLHAFFRALAGFGCITWGTLAFVQVVELVPTKHRTRITQACHLSFALGTMVIPVISFLFRSNIYDTIGFICLFGWLVLFLVYWFTGESPYWLAEKGKLRELEMWFRGLRRRNRRMRKLKCCGRRVFKNRSVTENE